MQNFTILLLIVIISAYCFSLVDGKELGAPTTACSDMKPQPTHLAGGEQTTTPLPYVITPEKLTYSAGETIRGIFIACFPL